MTPPPRRGVSEDSPRSDGHGTWRRRLPASGRRAASETIGFVFVFAIIVAMISTVYAVGFEGLQDIRDAEQVNNAQRAIEVLRDNVEDIAVRGAPRRATEIKLANAEIRSGTVATFEIEVQGHSTLSYEVQPIVYDDDARGQIVYSNGAIFRQGDGGSAMTHSPHFVIGSNRVVLPIVQTWVEGVEPPGASASLSGSSTVLVTTDSENRGVPIHNTSDEGKDVTITITSSRADAWDQYLSDQGMSCSISGDQVTCTLNDVEKAYVIRTLIGWDVV